MHFVVRPETERTVNSLLVDSGIACEIQVRTIMQHAYAELSNAVAYKPKFAGAIVPKSNRLLARSVALIETVDDNFIKVMDELSKINAPQNTIIQKLDALYRKNVGNDPYDKKLNGEVICSVLELLAPLAPEQIDTFLSTRPYVWDKIKQHKNAGEPFFQLPGILLLYYAASKFDSDILAKSFTFQDKLLGLFYTDQGIAHDL